MNDHDHDDLGAAGHNDVFVADPADADPFDDEPNLPGWPKPVGIISIILGGLFTLCGAAVPAQGWLNSQFLGGLEGGAPDVMTNPPTMTYVAGAFGVIVSITLLVGGITCILRKPVARKLLLTYGALGVVSFIWGVMIQLDTQDAIQEWMKQNPDAQFTQMQQQQGNAGAAVGLGCAAILGLPWPAFCLFWFGFVKTKPEDFTGGADLETI